MVGEKGKFLLDSLDRLEGEIETVPDVPIETVNKIEGGLIINGILENAKAYTRPSGGSYKPGIAIHFDYKRSLIREIVKNINGLVDHKLQDEGIDNEFLIDIYREILQEIDENVTYFRNRHMSMPRAIDFRKRQHDLFFYPLDMMIINGEEDWMDGKNANYARWFIENIPVSEILRIPQELRNNYNLHDITRKHIERNNIRKMDNIVTLEYNYLVSQFDRVYNIDSENFKQL